MPRYADRVTGTADRFPSTHATWLDAQLAVVTRGAVDPAASASAGDARAALRTHLMQRYYDALQAYVRTPALVELGEPAEIVGEFFARSVDAPEFLRRWRESGMPLRRWMMNAIAFHCRGLLRDRRRDAARTEPVDDDRLEAIRPDPSDAGRAFDRAWAVALAGEAFGIAQAEAEAAGRPDDAMAFRLHALDGRTHAEIAELLGITPAQSGHAVRRVGQAMRDAVHRLLREEGVTADELDRAVEEVLLLVEEARGE